jgi:1,4-dihydroxy-2-naphthoyl-CoA synthase
VAGAAGRKARAVTGGRGSPAVSGKDGVVEITLNRPELFIAARIAALAPLAVRGTKAALNQLTRQRAGEVVETALLAEGVTLASADLAEAIAAFKAKRAGAFTGR